MPKPPRPSPPQTKKTAGVAVDQVAGRAIVEKPIDPRQAGLFDAPLPKWIKPCLPTLVDKPPVGDNWIHEIKWDGYRVSAYVSAGKVVIRTRNGHDWTDRFPAIAASLLKLNVRSAVIDGEAVVLDDMGRSNFSELQADLTRHGSEQAVMYAFDLLFLDGEDLRTKPLEARREALGFLMRPASAVTLSEEYAGTGAELFRVACEHELEGIVSKRLDAPYRSGVKGLVEDEVRLVGSLRDHRLSTGVARRPRSCDEHQGGALRRDKARLRRVCRHRLQRSRRHDAARAARRSRDTEMHRRRAEGEGSRMGGARAAGRDCLSRADEGRRVAAREL